MCGVGYAQVWGCLEKKPLMSTVGLWLVTDPGSLN